MADLMIRLQEKPMLPPPISSTTSTVRRGSEASPNRSSFQSSNASRIHTPSTSIPSTPIISTRPSSPEKWQLHPGESDNLLTAVAAQERRVLELKEELQKAEVDLGKLKKQWAAHEAKKKRNEVRNSEQLQSLKTSFPEYHIVREDSPVSASRELERRKTLSSSAKTSQRKVFSGSRHTRTLSLLTTNNAKAETYYPPRGDSLKAKQRASPESIAAIPEFAVPETPPKLIKDLSKTSDREMIIETGKQLVGDFRQGFWTFVEDLKQVTVGDESSSVGGPGTSPKGTSHGPRKIVEKSKESLRENGPSSEHIQHHQQTDVWLGRNKKAIKSKQANRMVTGKGFDAREKGPDHLPQGLGIPTDSDNEEWENWDTKGSSELLPSKDLKTD